LFACALLAPSTNAQKENAAREPYGEQCVNRFGKVS